MERQHVRSSNIRSIGYDVSTLTLEVEFDNGCIYQYSNVPTYVHERFMSASSKGRFLNDHIKDRFRFKQVR